ncbi:MAG: SH3 domain-containing protein [Anaerolineae bacterium]
MTKEITVPSDNWMEETVPSRRADYGREPRGGERSSVRQIPLRVWIFALLAGVLLFALLAFWGLYLFRGTLGADSPTPTAVIWTVTPSPTSAATPTPTPTETRAAEEPSDTTPTPSTDIVIGGYVKVTGTGDYGLSLREGPGANYTRVDLATEGEVFIVVEGPQTAAGSPWWRIRDPENEERFWWAIGNYLEPVEHP